VPRLCEFYPGICLTTEKKARKNLSQGKKNLSQVKKKLSQSTVYKLPKTPTHYKTLTNTHTHMACTGTGLFLKRWIFNRAARWNSSLSALHVPYLRKHILVDSAEFFQRTRMGDLIWSRGTGSSAAASRQGAYR